MLSLPIEAEGPWMDDRSGRQPGNFEKIRDEVFESPNSAKEPLNSEVSSRFPYPSNHKV